MAKEKKQPRLIKKRLKEYFGKHLSGYEVRTVEAIVNKVQERVVVTIAKKDKSKPVSHKSRLEFEKWMETFKNSSETVADFDNPNYITVRVENTPKNRAFFNHGL